MLNAFKEMILPAQLIQVEAQLKPLPVTHITENKLGCQRVKKRPTDYFKKQLDEWLKGVPDQPKCGTYAGRAEGVDNSIDVKCTVYNTWR